MEKMVDLMMKYEGDDSMVGDFIYDTNNIHIRNSTNPPLCSVDKKVWSAFLVSRGACQEAHEACEELLNRVEND